MSKRIAAAAASESNLAPKKQKTPESQSHKKQKKLLRLGLSSLVICMLKALSDYPTMEEDAEIIDYAENNYDGFDLPGDFAQHVKWAHAEAVYFLEQKIAPLAKERACHLSK